MLMSQVKIENAEIREAVERAMQGTRSPRRFGKRETMLNNPFKRVTFEFKDGGVMEADLDSIEHIEISEDYESMTRMEITFLVPTVQWSQILQTKELKPPEPPALIME